MGRRAFPAPQPGRCPSWRSPNHLSASWRKRDRRDNTNTLMPLASALPHSAAPAQSFRCEPLARLNFR